MSKIDTTELGIAIVCGAVATGLANGFAGLAPGLAFALGAVVSGVILMLRGYGSKDANSADDDDEEPKKRPAKNNKNKNPLKKQPIVEQFQPEQKGKSKKKKKKGGGETSPAQKPASKAKKSAKDSSSSDDEGVLSKAKSQTQAIYEKARAKAVEAEKKAGKKAGEYGKKVGEKVGDIGKKAKEIEKKITEKTGEIGKKAGDLVKKAGDLGKRAGERAGDLGKKVGEKAGDLKGKGEEALKKAAAAQKKAQAKARKEAQKLEEQLGNVFQAQMRDSVGEEKSTEGWEQITSKKQFRSKDPKEKKPESNYTGEVRVAPKSVGAVMGKEGATLKALSENLNCDIRFQKDGQTFHITGEKASVLEAKRAILALEKNGYSSVTHPQHKSEGVHLTDEKQVGAVAGSKGKYVKDIQSETGAKIILPKKDSGDLTVGIVGRPEEIEAAREAIQDLLEQGYSRITHPGWITEEVEFPVELLGRLIGEKGASIKDISTKFGIRIDTPRREDPDSRQDVIYIKGPPAKIELTKKYILEDLFKEENPEEEDDAPAPDDPWQQEPEAPEW